MPTSPCSTSTARCSTSAASAPRSAGFANIAFVEANAEELPFADASFDAYTIAFGIRNVPRIEAALAEAYRVLKPGGRFLCLEFSEVDMPMLDRLYEPSRSTPSRRSGASWPATPNPIAIWSNRSANFPNQESFAAMVRAAGFARVTFRNFSGGIAALHSGWKL